MVSIDLRDYSTTYQRPREPNVVRDAYVLWLRQALTNDRPVLIIRGSAGSGKTRLATQFVDRDPSRVISYFVGDDIFTSSPERFLWDLCAQLSPLLRRAELPADVSPSQLEGLLATLLGQLSAASRRANQPYYLVVDGIDRAVATGRGRSFADLARIGRNANIHVLLTSNDDPRPGLGIEEAEIREIQLFGHPETEAFLRQFKLSETDVMRLHEASRGYPVYLDVIRRQLESGAEVGLTIDQLPASLHDLFMSIWARSGLDAQGERILAFVAYSADRTELETLSSLARIRSSEIERTLGPLEFVEVGADGVVAWTTSAFAEFAAAQLIAWRAEVEVQLLEYYESRPESKESQTVLPALLARRGNYEGLRRLVQSAALSRALNITKSIPMVQRNLVLAADQAVLKADVGTLAGLATSVGVLDATMSSFATFEWQIDALAALGRWDDARKLAAELVLPEDRIRALASIANALRVQSLPQDLGLEEGLELLVDQLGIHTPEHAAQLAVTLFDTRPDLALKIVRTAAGDAGPRALERALTLLTLGAAVRDGQLDRATLFEAAQGPWQTAGDQSLIRTSDLPAPEVLAMVARTPDAASQIFLLRMWCNRHRRNGDAHEVVAAAFDILTASGDYGAPIRTLRQLSEPLRNMPIDHAKSLASRLQLLVDGANQAPQIELIRVRMILSEVAARWDLEYGKSQLREVAEGALQLADLDTRAEALSHLLSPLSTGPLRDPVLRARVSTAVDAAFEGVIADSADQYRVCIRALRALARIDLSRALALALKLNTTRRRDAALKQLISQSISSNQPSDLETMLVIAQEIVDTLDDRPAALRRVYRWVSEAAVAKLEQLPELQRLATDLPDPHDRAVLCTMLARAFRTSENEAARALTTLGIEHVRQIDDPWRMRVAAAEMIQLLADWHPEAANLLYNEVDRPDRTAASDPVFGPLLAEAIEPAIVGFYSAGDTRSYERLTKLIALLPSPAAQVHLLSALGIRCEALGLTAESLQLSKRVHVLLESVSDQYARAHCAATAAQFMAARADPGLDAFLGQVPYPASDGARLSAAVHLLTGVMPDVGFDFEAPMAPVSFERTHRALLLARGLASDSTYYLASRLVADAVTRHSSRFSRTQAFIVAEEIQGQSVARSPDTRGIEHPGYRILMRAEATRVRHSMLPKGRKDWGGPLTEAKAIPNVADRSLVLSRLAKYIWSDDRPLARAIAKEAADLIPSIPNVIDRIERIEEAAGALFEFRSHKDASAMLAAAFPLVRTLELTLESEAIVEAFVDVVDRIDPELAGALTTEVEERARIVTIRERSIVHELRRNPSAAARAKEEDAEIVPRRLADAADLLVQALGSGQVGATSQAIVVRWLRDVMTGHWHHIFSVSRWAAENARLGTWPEVTRAAIRDGLIDGAEFAALAGQVVRSIGEITPVLELVSAGSATIRAGARDEGLSVLRDWILELSPSSVQLVDPYFEPSDLVTLASVAAVPELRIFAGSRLNPGTPSRTAEELLQHSVEAWRQARLDDPPRITVVVMGNAIGKCPFHDRYVLTDDGGISMGTSLGGLGSRDSVLSKVGPERVADERAKLGEWMLAGVPILDGSRVDVTSASFK